jgi:hypothetical protein
VRPTSLREAMKLCTEYAQAKHNRSVDRIAELMGEPSPWNLYKWMSTGRMPANLIRPFEHACGCTFITQYIATSAHRLPIPIPKGQPATGQDIHDLQTAVTEATGQLLQYQRGEASAEATLAAIDRAMGGLAYQRRNVERDEQPELALEDDQGEAS